VFLVHIVEGLNLRHYFGGNFVIIIFYFCCSQLCIKYFCYRVQTVCMTYHFHWYKTVFHWVSIQPKGHLLTNKLSTIWFSYGVAINILLFYL